MKNYSNPIEEYDERAIKAWHVADMLQEEIEASVERDRWAQAEAGYEELREAVTKAIKDLKAIY